MTLSKRLLFYLLRWMDDIYPGWGEPKRPDEDYLSHQSYAFWMTREGRSGR